MTKGTEGDEILLDSKLVLLEIDLFALCSKVEEGRERFAPGVKPVRLPELNALECGTHSKVPIAERLCRLRMFLTKFRKLVSSGVRKESGLHSVVGKD